MYRLEPEHLEGQSVSVAAEVAAEHLEAHTSGIADALQTAAADQQAHDREFGRWLGVILKSGVWLASLVVLTGGVLYVMQHGMEPVNYHHFRGEPARLRSPVGVITAVRAGQPRGVIQLGLLILIATPIVRVAVSWLVFMKRRDIVYSVVTGLVLIGLMYSLLMAYL
ncbi:MAG TPA: DUF1634 domain-containing protein [Chroococcidiopsis sp.]